jgi:hypothetical protein
MKRFSSLFEAEFRHALAWGTEPSIVITTLPRVGPGGCGADGLFVPAPPQLRFKSGVQDFEAGPMIATDLNARGEKVIIVGAVLLYELCHWGNFRHKVADISPIELERLGRMPSMAPSAQRPPSSRQWPARSRPANLPGQNDAAKSSAI